MIKQARNEEVALFVEDSSVQNTCMEITLGVEAIPLLCTSWAPYSTFVHRVQNVPNPSRIAILAISLAHSSYPNAILLVLLLLD